MPKSSKLNFVLSPQLEAKLIAQAEKEGLAKSELIRRSVSLYLNLFEYYDPDHDALDIQVHDRKNDRYKPLAVIV